MMQVSSFVTVFSDLGEAERRPRSWCYLAG